MTLSGLLDQWSALVNSAANVILYVAGLLGIILVVRALLRAHTTAAEGRNATPYYVAAGVGGALTCLGLIAGALSRLVVG